MFAIARPRRPIPIPLYLCVASSDSFFPALNQCAIALFLSQVCTPIECCQKSGVLDLAGEESQISAVYWSVLDVVRRVWKCCGHFSLVSPTRNSLICCVCGYIVCDRVLYHAAGSA
jgi:hypothetical protein